jgi:4,5-dihydroxyphthalate decarboxylase
MDALHRRVMEITGRDPLPYGIGPSRQALEEALRSALEQGIISRPVAVEELFARNTQSLTA